MTFSILNTRFVFCPAPFSRHFLNFPAKKNEPMRKRLPPNQGNKKGKRKKRRRRGERERELQQLEGRDPFRSGLNGRTVRLLFFLLSFFLHHLLFLHFPPKEDPLRSFTAPLRKHKKIQKPTLTRPLTRRKEKEKINLFFPIILLKKLRELLRHACLGEKENAA